MKKFSYAPTEDEFAKILRDAVVDLQSSIKSVEKLLSTCSTSSNQLIKSKYMNMLWLVKDLYKMEPMSIKEAKALKELLAKNN